MKKSILSIVLFFAFCQVFSQVVINEVMVKPSGGDTDQAFQSMYNSTTTFGSEYVATVKNEEKLKQYLKKDERHNSKSGR